MKNVQKRQQNVSGSSLHIIVNIIRVNTFSQVDLLAFCDVNHHTCDVFVIRCCFSCKLMLCILRLISVIQLIIAEFSDVIFLTFVKLLTDSTQLH